MRARGPQDHHSDSTGPPPPPLLLLHQEMQMYSLHAQGVLPGVSYGSSSPPVPQLVSITSTGFSSKDERLDARPLQPRPIGMRSVRCCTDVLTTWLQCCNDVVPTLLRRRKKAVNPKQRCYDIVILSRCCHNVVTML